MLILPLSRFTGSAQDTSNRCVCELTIKTQVLKVAVSEIVLHDCHESGHLAEQQHSVVGGLELR